MKRRLVPPARFALLPCLLVLLAVPVGCGDPDAEAPRVRVTVMALDGAPPPDLRAVMPSKESGGADTSFALVPVSGAQDLYEVPGAPDGPFRVEAAEGWWMFQLGPVLPELRRGRVPTPVRLGRARSLYLGAEAASVRPGLRWGAERLLEGGGREPLAVEVAEDEDGYVIVLRFTNEAWQGEVEVIGTVRTGMPDAPAPVDTVIPLTQAIRFYPPESGRPVATKIRRAPSAPLDVVLVAASPRVEVEGRTVSVRIADLPLDVSAEVPCRDGAARFPPLPAVGRPLRIEEAENVFFLDEDTRSREGALRLLVLGDLETQEMRLGMPEGGDAVERALLRPAEAVAFGRVPVLSGEGVLRIRVPRGTSTLFLRSGTRWARYEMNVRDDGTEPPVLPAPRFEEGVAVRGQVEGGRPGTVVRFFLQQGREAVLGDGFEVRVSQSGTYEAFLPTGTWHVEVADADREWKRPMPVVAEESGTAVHLPLPAP